MPTQVWYDPMSGNRIHAVYNNCVTDSKVWADTFGCEAIMIDETEHDREITLETKIVFTENGAVHLIFPPDPIIEETP